MADIPRLTISYPDFKLNTVADPEQFDTNNAEIVDRINDIVDKLHSTADGNSGGDEIRITPVTNITGNTVQSAFEDVGSKMTHIQNAETQANYAKAQGDYAKQQGDIAKSKGDNVVANGDYATTQGDYAKAQGDYAKAQGDLVGQIDIVALTKRVEEIETSKYTDKTFNDSMNKMTDCDGESVKIKTIKGNTVYDSVNSRLNSVKLHNINTQSKNLFDVNSSTDLKNQQDTYFDVSENVLTLRTNKVMAYQQINVKMPKLKEGNYTISADVTSEKTNMNPFLGIYANVQGVSQSLGVSINKTDKTSTFTINSTNKDYDWYLRFHNNKTVVETNVSHFANIQIIETSSYSDVYTPYEKHEEQVIKMLDEYTMTNLLGERGSFRKDSDGDGLTDGWIVANSGNFSINNGEQSYTVTAQNGSIYASTTGLTSGHVLYATAQVKADSNLVIFNTNPYLGTNKTHSGSGNYERLSAYGVCNSTHIDVFALDARTSGFTPIKIKEYMLLDLTAIFGAGKEPDEAWCNANIDYFENTTTRKFSDKISVGLELNGINNLYDTLEDNKVVRRNKDYYVKISDFDLYQDFTNVSVARLKSTDFAMATDWNTSATTIQNNIIGAIPQKAWLDDVSNVNTFHTWSEGSNRFISFVVAKGTSETDAKQLFESTRFIYNILEPYYTTQTLTGLSDVLPAYEDGYMELVYETIPPTVDVRYAINIAGQRESISDLAHENAEQINDANEAIFVMSAEVENLKYSVSNGKRVVANAITDAGGTANPLGTFAELATAIGTLGSASNQIATNPNPDGNGWTDYGSPGATKAITGLPFKPRMVYLIGSNTPGASNFEGYGYLVDANVFNSVSHYTYQYSGYNFNSDLVFGADDKVTSDGFRSTIAMRYLRWVAIK